MRDADGRVPRATDGRLVSVDHRVHLRRTRARSVDQIKGNNREDSPHTAAVVPKKGMEDER
eukprot:6189278-Pleurochrysis_carterae.AAC.5